VNRAQPAHPRGHGKVPAQPGPGLGLLRPQDAVDAREPVRGQGHAGGVRGRQLCPVLGRDAGHPQARGVCLGGQRPRQHQRPLPGQPDADRAHVHRVQGQARHGKVLPPAGHPGKVRRRGAPAAAAARAAPPAGRLCRVLAHRPGPRGRGPARAKVALPGGRVPPQPHLRVWVVVGRRQVGLPVLQADDEERILHGQRGL
ncbi:hypothetical protein H4R18_001918, partial [Coemansia javaensis]